MGSGPPPPYPRDIPVTPAPKDRSARLSSLASPTTPGITLKTPGGQGCTSLCNSESIHYVITTIQSSVYHGHRIIHHAQSQPSFIQTSPTPLPKRVKSSSMEADINLPGLRSLNAHATSFTPGQADLQCQPKSFSSVSYHHHSPLQLSRSSSPALPKPLYPPHRDPFACPYILPDDPTNRERKLLGLPKIDGSPENRNLTPPPSFFSEFHNMSDNAQTLREQGETNGNLHPALYDQYASSPSPLASITHTSHQAQINPYSQDPSTSGGVSYYQNSAFAQPIQYHLYAPLGPHRENLLPYQRSAYDFFISETLREDLQRKSAATLQTLPSASTIKRNTLSKLMILDSTLPPQIDHFHSLVPLDTTNQKNATLFGYPSWIYKAVSSKDGNTYALRRLEGKA